MERKFRGDKSFKTCVLYMNLFERSSRRIFLFNKEFSSKKGPGCIYWQGLATQLFAASLFPYLGFLYFLNKTKLENKLVNFGFGFLLVFVGATIPAGKRRQMMCWIGICPPPAVLCVYGRFRSSGIYAKTHYHTSLANVDWLHGSAESLLTFTNIFIVLGLRQEVERLAKKAEDSAGDESSR